MVGGAFADDVQIPEDMFVCEIPGGEYLVYEILLPQIGEAFGHAGKWMEENSYTYPHGVSFEYYDERMHNEDPNKQFIDLYIPIVKK